MSCASEQSMGSPRCCRNVRQLLGIRSLPQSQALDKDKESVASADFIDDDTLLPAMYQYRPNWLFQHKLEYTTNTMPGHHARKPKHVHCQHKVNV